MLYDTIYACQDKVDDIKTGVRSTAILFGSWIEPLLTLCGILFLAMLVLAGFANQQGVLYFVVSVGGTALHLIWQFTTVDLDVPSSCWSMYSHDSGLQDTD
jgi:4-hydroxybenzoate polyprenyltransferase